MTLVQLSTVATNSSDADFRTWGSAICAAIISVGWVQTADTGQIDWGTITAPTTYSQSMGYAIFRMNDTMQATTPVFIKLEFGSGGNAAYPGMWITIGKGSDGAGNITSVLFDRSQMATSSSTASAVSSWVSGTSSRLAVMAFWSRGGTGVACFAIERSHNSQGVDVDGAIDCVTMSYNGKFSRHMPYAGVLPGQFTAWNCIVPPSGSGALSPNVNVFPVRTWTPGESYPMHSVMTYVSTDFTSGTTVAVTSYDNVSRDYLTLNAFSVAYGGTGHSMWRCD